MRVRWLDGAKQQLFIETLGLFSAKDRRALDRDIHEATQNLAMFPELGRMRDAEREDIRVLWVRDYRLTYVIDPEQDEVLIISFVSGRRRGDALD